MQIKYEVGDAVQYQENNHSIGTFTGEIIEIRQSFVKIRMSSGQEKLVHRLKLIPLEVTIQKARFI